MTMAELTHIDAEGRAHMVDVTDKPKTSRMARAHARIAMRPDVVDLIRTGGSKKGDVLAVAQVAGIMAAKRTWELIPLCHPIALTSCDVEFSLGEDAVEVFSRVRCAGETGVEMEALAAASTAALTIYDMCKAVQRDMEIDQVFVLEKDGGASGRFLRDGI
jgi:cyclic pyranopterin phosphate synthase